MRRIRSLSFSLATAVLAASVALTPTGAASQPSATRVYAFSFADADIASVADEILGQALKLPFTVDPTVTGKITLRVERRLTRDQLLAVLEAALAQSGASLVRGADGVYAIVPRAKARASSSVQTGRGGRPGYQIVAEPVRFAAPSELAKVLADLGAGDVVLRADDRLGLIVLGGTAAEIAAARENLAVFDRSALSDARSRVVNLKIGSADAVAADLNRLATAAELSGVAIVPMRQLNALVLLARTPDTLDQLEGWALRLDLPPAEEPTTLWVYRPRNVSAEALAEALRSLSRTDGGSMPPAAANSESAEPVSFDESVPVAAATPLAFDPSALKVSVERSSNSLLVMAPASRWRSLQAALEQIDRIPDQVLIEATILEVTLNQDFRLGVDWSLVSADGKLGSVLSAFETGAVTPVYPGVSLTYLNTEIHAVISALSARTNVEVMSAPKLLALDNQSASLQVGDQVPVVVQRAQGTGAPGAPLVTTTEYRDTGVILKIKPRINGDRSVLLEVSQEVSEVARTTTSGIDLPTIQQRRFESTLSLQEGQTLAIGGLISAARHDNATGAPILKDIPLVGGLFRTTTKGQRRTELIVFLSARIVRAGSDGQASTETLKGQMGEIGRRGLMTGRDAGFLTPVFGMVAVALSLISLASLQLARNDQVAERRSMERLQERYRADGAAVIAVWRIVHEAEPGVLKWQETVAGQPFLIVAEPEIRKLALSEAGGVRGRARLRAALGEDAGDRLSVRLADLAERADEPPSSEALRALDRGTAWRACGRSLVSPYSRLTEYALAAPQKPTTGTYVPRAGEVWRILVANDRRVLIDRLVRFTGDVQTPAAILDEAAGEASGLSPLNCAEHLQPD